MSDFRDATIIIYLIYSIVIGLFTASPQMQAWHQVQVDRHYEIYAVEVGLWE